MTHHLIKTEGFVLGKQFTFSEFCETKFSYFTRSNNTTPKQLLHIFF